MALLAVTRWLSTVAIGLAALTGCAPGGSPHSGAAAVVASTDVWGSVASAVAGRHDTVKSILSGATVDPHTYQASPSDAAAIIDAALVVFNGGGYDGWVGDVLSTHQKIKPVDAFSFLPDAGDDERPPNEHVFYDLDVVKAVATTIADRLAAIDPVSSADYRANAAAFCRAVDAIANTEHAVASTYPNTSVIATEPVGYYLLQASGLVNRTPPTFSQANENGTDPSPADMAYVLDLVSHRQVSAVLINPQTSNPAINSLKDAARRAGVPITEVTETLPNGTDYLTWQRNTVNQLVAALQSNRRSHASH
jgi:zinc/manganese transport system substrate-binding protein